MATNPHSNRPLPDALSPVRAPELIFGLIAPIGVDLELVSSVLAETLREVHYDTHMLRLTALMREMPIDLPLDATTYVESYRQRIAFANEVRRRFGDNALAALAVSAIRAFRAEERQRRRYEKASDGISGDSQNHSEQDEEIPLPNKAYIIRQLKRPEEILLLRSIYGKQFVLVSAYAPAKWRQERIEHSEKRTQGGLIQEGQAHSRAYDLIVQDAKEVEEEHGQNVRDAFPLGDVFIDATSRQKCEEALTRFIRLLFGNNEITPTRDEYGMYLAKSASLRSSDLSRQVGAAIFRSTGEIASLGSNEVPKSGGGTYWIGDDPDGRDFVIGHDANERKKREILIDVVARLRNGGHLSENLMKIQDPILAAEQLLKEMGENSISDSKVMDIIEFGRAIHAEMSAISDAARLGIPIRDSTLYCTTFPCHICAKHIVVAGLKDVVYLEPYPKSYASELHSDSIAVDTDDPGKKSSISSLHWSFSI